MNMPPAEPMNYAPPPPTTPPPKSNVLKWVLIGCGGATLVGLLACGGCALLIVLGVKQAANEAVAKVKPIIADNPTVRQEVGEVREVTPSLQGFRTEKRNGVSTVHFTLDVVGTTGKGTVEGDLREIEGPQEEMLVTLTFVSADGRRKTPIGRWRLYDDGKGNAGFTPVDDGPDDAPPPHVPEPAPDSED